MEHTNPRVERIIQSIESYANDAYTDAHSAGYDEGFAAGQDSVYEETRNRAYDEGWEDACEYIIEKLIPYYGMCTTPQTDTECGQLVQNAMNPMMAVMFASNFFRNEISKMKGDKE